MSNDHDHEHEHDNEQEVTDPVTHLPIKVHDISKVELERIPPNDPEELDAEDLYSHQQQQHSKSSSSSQLSSHDVGDDKWAIKKQDSNARHDALHSLLLSTTGKWYKDPKGDTARARAQAALVSGAAAGLGALGFWFVRDVVAGGGGGGWRWWDLLLVPLACAVIGIGVVGAGVGIGFVQRPAEEPPNPPRQHKENSEDEQLTTPHTLNNLIRSVWPIVNPALFTPLADMLEDSLQSSVPSTIHGVRVSEIGQGKKPIRVVGVRWLDPGAASRDVDSADKQGDEGQGDGEGQEEGGMKAEEGDFVNLELALAYRSDESTEKDFSERSKNLHLLTHFYLPSNITLPIWMSLTSLLMTVRVRVTLTPNPPFVSLCTLTILGKPHVRLSCTPLAKHFMNVMDIPLLSSYVQSAVDAAVGMYVAPRSICLDLGMLLGGTEQKDVMALGVVLLTVRSANGMKGSGKGDVYVTVCWAKWGKPLWSSRIIQHQSTPIWEETTTLLVGPEEVGSHEMVRVQLWDSDRFTADDHLGTATVSLSDLMSPNKLNKLQIRTDKLTTDSGSPKDGTLTWEVGYFGKVGLREYRSDAEELERKTMEEAERKLSEALPPGEEDTGEEQGEIEQQKKEDLKAKTDDILSSSPPLEEWPSGILCVRIEQIRGLEVIHVRETGVKEEQGEEGEEERGEKELPSSYCSIFVNDVRVYKTRTKMKTRNPYFNASTEKFIRHWPSTTLLISVHDQRTQEVNPLLGVLVLPLKDIFKHSASFTSSMPLVGGVGYGRMQITLLFRSVMMRVPRRLLGWDVGEIRVSRVEVAEGLDGAGKWRVVLSSDFGKAKFVPVDSMVHRSDGEDEYQHAEGVVRWKPNHRKAVRLPILNRYASSVLVKFRKRVVGPDLTPAYGVLWLKDLVDGEEVEVDVPIRRNRKKTGVDGRSRCAVQPGVAYPEGEGGEEYSIVEREGQEEGEDGEDGDGDGEEEEVIGKLRLTVRFVPGLSPAHSKLAKEDKNLREAMDVLRCAEAEREVARGILDDTRSSSPSSSSSSSSSSDTDSDSSSLPKSLSSASSHIPLVHDLKEYHDHADELHRKHRGLMQWSPARKVASLGKGVESAAGDVKRKVKGVVGHSKPEVGIEHEV